MRGRPRPRRGSLAIAIRPLTSDDVEEYRGLRLAALLESPDAFGSALEEEAERPVSHFERRLVTSTIFAAYEGPRIVASARFTAESGLKDRHKGSLGGMYVEPTSRRRGVGDAIVRAVIGHAVGWSSSSSCP